MRTPNPKKVVVAARVQDIRRKRSSHLRHVSRKQLQCNLGFHPNHSPSETTRQSRIVRSEQFSLLQQCRAAHIHLQAQAGNKVGTNCMDGLASRGCSSVSGFQTQPAVVREFGSAHTLSSCTLHALKIDDRRQMPKCSLSRGLVWLALRSPLSRHPHSSQPTSPSSSSSSSSSRP